MTTYSEITAAQVDADSYVDTVLIGQLKNNVLAMFEGDASASGVRLQTAALEQAGGSEAVITAAIRALAVTKAKLDAAAVDASKIDFTLTSGSFTGADDTAPWVPAAGIYTFSVTAQSATAGPILEVRTSSVWRQPLGETWAGSFVTDGTNVRLRTTHATENVSGFYVKLA